MLEDKSATLVMFKHSSDQAGVQSIIFDQQNMNLFLHAFTHRNSRDSQSEIVDECRTTTNFCSLEKEFTSKGRGNCYCRRRSQGPVNRGNNVLKGLEHRKRW